MQDVNLCRNLKCIRNETIRLNIKPVVSQKWSNKAITHGWFMNQWKEMDGNIKIDKNELKKKLCHKLYLVLKSFYSFNLHKIIDGKNQCPPLVCHQFFDSLLLYVVIYSVIW